VLFDDFDSASPTFSDHLLHLDVCGQFKVYRQGPERPHAYYDATEHLRQEICAKYGAPIQARSSFVNAWAPERVVSDAARDHGCDASRVRILGHGWNIHFVDEAFELDVCGTSRLYRKRVLRFGFYDATDEGRPLPCVGTSADAAAGGNL
jgi:hypothetical protein